MTQSITQIEKVIYTARAYTTGGRDGGASRTSVPAASTLSFRFLALTAPARTRSNCSPSVGHPASCWRSRLWPLG